MVAEILHPGAAVFAGLIRLVQPGNPDARADGEPPRALAGRFDDADDLVTWNHRGFARREFPFDHVQIGAADAARLHADEHFSFAGPRYGHIGEFERISLDRRGRTQKAGFHRVVTEPPPMSSDSNGS
jgi:hypothetical protein